MCVHVCVCLSPVLLLVRWVSVKRITTVSLLYPHTLSQRPTFTRPTFHAIQPPSSALFATLWKTLNKKKKLKKKYIVLEAGFKCSVYFMCPLRRLLNYHLKRAEWQLNKTFRKVRIPWSLKTRYCPAAIFRFFMLHMVYSSHYNPD